MKRHLGGDGGDGSKGSPRASQRTPKRVKKKQRGPPKGYTTFSAEALSELALMLKTEGKMLCTEPAKVGRLLDGLKEIAEIMTFGDSNERVEFWNTFLECDIYKMIFDFLHFPDCLPCVHRQVIQSLTLMLANFRTRMWTYYLLSNRKMMELICHPYAFDEDENLLSHYIAFLKTIVIRLDKELIQFFIDNDRMTFHLYTEAIKYADHPDRMVQIAIRAITLKIYSIQDPTVLKIILHKPPGNGYFSSVLNRIRRFLIEFDVLLLKSVVEGFGNPRNKKRGTSSGHGDTHGAGDKRIRDVAMDLRDQVEYLQEILLVGDPDIDEQLLAVMDKEFFGSYFVRSFVEATTHPNLFSHRARELRSLKEEENITTFRIDPDGRAVFDRKEVLLEYPSMSTRMYAPTVVYILAIMVDEVVSPSWAAALVQVLRKVLEPYGGSFVSWVRDVVRVTDEPTERDVLVACFLGLALQILNWESLDKERRRRTGQLTPVAATDDGEAVGEGSEDKEVPSSTALADMFRTTPTELSTFIVQWMSSFPSILHGLVVLHICYRLLVMTKASGDLLEPLLDKVKAKVLLFVSDDNPLQILEQFEDQYYRFRGLSKLQCDKVSTDPTLLQRRGDPYGRKSVHHTSGPSTSSTWIHVLFTLTSLYHKLKGVKTRAISTMLDIQPKYLPKEEVHVGVKQLIQCCVYVNPPQGSKTAMRTQERRYLFVEGHHLYLITQHPEKRGVGTIRNFVPLHKLTVHDSAENGFTIKLIGFRKQNKKFVKTLVFDDHVKSEEAKKFVWTHVARADDEKKAVLFNEVLAVRRSQP